jgi:hypothetical protein
MTPCITTARRMITAAADAIRACHHIQAGLDVYH